MLYTDLFYEFWYIFMHIYVLKIKIKLGYISKRNSAIHKWHKNLKLSWRLERNHALSSRQENQIIIFTISDVHTYM